jgi:hypothetical protein
MTPVVRPPWLLAYVLWVVTGKTNPRPTSIPATISRLYLFIPAWVKWRLNGGIPAKRPASVPADLTGYPWRYDLYHEVKLALSVIVPPPKPDPAPSKIKRCMCLAEDAVLAEAFSMRHPVAVTADPAYASHVNDSVIARLRAGGRSVHAWFVPTQVSLGDAQEFKRRYGLDELIGQGETHEQMARTLEYGLRFAWVNMSVMDASQLKAINDGKIDVLAEFYKNTQPWMTKDWRNARVTGSLIASYGPPYSAAENPWHQYRPVAVYIATGELNANTDGGYCPGFQAADYRDFPR